MKKIYTLLAIAILGVTFIGNAANGTATFQIDMNVGNGEPDLIPEETEAVEASFENGVLTINKMFYGFNALAFTIDMETGEAVAIEQVALEEDGFIYYYYDVASKEPELIGTINNVGSDKCELVLPAWGPGAYFPGVGVFFEPVFYNTVFTFDFAIPGLMAEVEAPLLEIESVTYDTVTSEYGAYVQFTVEVASENLPEGSEIEVYYKGPYDNDFKEAEENSDGTFGFSIAGLEPETDYSVAVYAQAGTVVSDIETIEFIYNGAGVASLTGDESQSKYYDLKGIEVKNLQPGEVYIQKNNRQTKKILIQ